MSAHAGNRPRVAAPVVVAFAGLVVGATLVSVAYALASRDTSTNTYFPIFWAGFVLGLAPALVAVCTTGTTRAERTAVLVALGLFSILAKILRSPGSFVFFDELGHWRQTEALRQTGHVFGDNAIVHILPYFPGLHELTATVSRASGLSVTTVAMIELSLFHVVALLGVAMLVERLTGSSRAGAIAAVIYLIGPGFIYFNSQFAYESLAIVFVIWTLVALVSAGYAAQERNTRGRYGWLMLGAVLAAATVVTHHLSSYALIVAVVLVAAATWWRARSDDDWRLAARDAAIFAVGLALAVIAWSALVASPVLDYISPYVGDTLRAVWRSGRSPSRRLFESSGLPTFERVASYVSPVLAAVAAAGALLVFRRRRPEPATVGIAGFGLLYLASMPLMLLTGADQPARRSWAFTYLGVALLAAVAITTLLDRVRRPRSLRPAIALGLVAVAVSVGVIGNTAVDVNEQYRFPGTFVYGADTRSITPETIAAARWLRSTAGPNAKVIADRGTGLALAAYGDADPTQAVDGLPIWDLYFKTDLPSEQLLRSLADRGYRWLAVDSRMATSLPRIGVYFGDREPGAHAHRSPVPAAALDKFDTLPWATRAYASAHIRIYALDLDAAIASGHAGTTAAARRTAR